MTAGDPPPVPGAQETARRVLVWAAAAPAHPARPADAPTLLPSGPLHDAGSLARPAPGTLAALGDLVRDTGARMGAGRPPFGDAGSVGAGALCLAAAIGGRKRREAAERLAELVAPPRLVEDSAPGAWIDALARHAVTAPALTALEPADQLAETLLRCSPLTAVLHRPAAGRTATDTTAEVAAAAALLTRPHGADVLRATFARWMSDPAVLSWRTDLLDRLARSDRRAERELVADVYLAARLRHGPEWDRRLRKAGRALSGRGQPDPLSLATASYWSPLAGVWDREPGLVRARRYLTGYDKALMLVRRHRLAPRGSA